MESIGDRQNLPQLPRLSWRSLTTGILAAAGIGAALLFTAGEAEATPVTIPGIGQFEVADELAARLGIIAPAPEAAVVEVPVVDESIIESYEFRPVTILGAGVNSRTPRLAAIPEQPGRPVLPESAPAALPESSPAVMPESAPVVMPESVPANIAAESRQVTVAGLGEFSIPSALPSLMGIPGVTDTAAVPAPMPAAMPKKSAGERAVEAARTKIGSNYRAGGAGPDNFDCSGLVQWSYHEAGVDLPRTSYSQLAAGTPVSVDELQPGDLVSFYGGGHSALYAGDGQVIHAATYGSGVKLSPMSEMPVSGARRF
ncbi:C40 family peptidase [Nocardia sp. NPDC056100]|uniref:C40 family peptidase n=1 Tax=Nocardia sp. NPDC056100 TaxID=3345712 RepID=UPI0035E1D36E